MAPKFVQNVTKISNFLEPLFDGSWTSSGGPWDPSWLPQGCLGRPQDVILMLLSRQNARLRNGRFSWLWSSEDALERILARLGADLGPKWSPKWAQNWSKKWSTKWQKTNPKMTPKWSPKWAPKPSKNLPGSNRLAGAPRSGTTLRGFWPVFFCFF